MLSPGFLRRLFRMTIARPFTARKRRRLMERFGWYRNMIHGWAHPHCLDYMSGWEAASYTMPQLEYKLRHGSMSALPESLRDA